MNSAAVFLMPAVDAARSALVLGPDACGTYSNLAAGASHPPLAASAGRRPSHPPPSPGNPIPARANQAALPGGGGLILVVTAPANPFLERKPWSANATPTRSSIASASSSRRVARSSLFAARKACRTGAPSSAGRMATVSLPHGCARPASSDTTIGHTRRSRQRRRRQTLRLVAWHSTPSVGTWPSSLTLSATSLSSKAR